MCRNVFLQFGIYKVTTRSMTNFSIDKVIDCNWSKKKMMLVVVLYESNVTLSIICDLNSRTLLCL
jgi:hypothetical protein